MTETPIYHLALPKSGKGPGVLVLHAWWGLNDFTKVFCDRLAQEKADWVRAVNAFYGNGWNVQQSNAAYQYHFAETDPYVSEEDKKGLEGSLNALGRPVIFHTYPGTGHWFMETDRPDAYNAEAAKLAWERTIAFLHEHLGE